jgi:hypothetical protein
LSSPRWTLTATKAAAAQEASDHAEHRPAAPEDVALLRVIPEHWPSRVSYNALVAAMSTFLGIVIAAVSVCTFAAVVWMFIWAAKKDGEEDRAVQRRLGIRRRTRLGR